MKEVVDIFKFHANTILAAMWIKQLSQYLLVIRIMERLSVINRKTKLFKNLPNFKKKKTFTRNLKLTLMKTMIS